MSTGRKQLRPVPVSTSNMEDRILRVIFAFIFVIIMKQQLVRINRLIHFDRLKKRRMLEPKTAAEELTSANPEYVRHRDRTRQGACAE